MHFEEWRTKMPLKESKQIRSRGVGKREKKLRHILHLIHSGFNVSRLDLARMAGVSPASITAIAQRLIKAGLVVEAEGGSSALGRKPVPLEIRADAAHLIGLDIGTFYMRVAITDINGIILFTDQTESDLPAGRDRVLEMAVRFVRKAISDSGLPKHTIKGIGIAHSSIIDTRSGIILFFPRPGHMAEWKNFPLQSLFEKEFGVPCLLEDSVRASATAEQRFGLGKGQKDFLYIDVGMGVGAALFFDGKLYRGPGGKSGEFGHFTSDENGPLCSCGNNGCLETMASCAAIIRAARAAMECGVDSKILDLAGGNLDSVSIEAIARAAALNDSLAFRVLQVAGSHLAIGLADLINLLNPSLIIFGGALFRAVPELLSDPIWRIIKQRSIELSANDVKLQVSPLGSDATALGAARLIAERILDGILVSSLQPTSQ
jgi:predicted NBD/HSP70 family sugar kinase